MKAKVSPLTFGCCVLSLLVLSLSPAYPEPPKSNPSATQQVTKQDTPTYTVNLPCLGMTPAGAIPASLLKADLENLLNKLAKGGWETVSVAPAPNLIVGKKPDGKSDVRTGCFTVISRKYKAGTLKPISP